MDKERVSDPRLDKLIDILKGMGSALLAYSGGLDSTFLLKALKLSGIRALAVTSNSDTTPPHDLRDASVMADEIGIEHRVIRTSEMHDESFVKNSPDRCFYCKDKLFGLLGSIAKEEDYAFVLDGGTVDDLDDHRPGAVAARKHGIRSPLVEAGFTKEEIRDVSRRLGLRTWDKPSSPCLSSRLPYGTRITGEALKRISGAEEFLRSLGFRELRVRDHGALARVEVPEKDIEKLFSLREQVAGGLRKCGYKFVSLDLEGLRSGSMNRVLE
jgi:uncharacterized protein